MKKEEILEQFKMDSKNTGIFYSELEIETEIRCAISRIEKIKLIWLATKLNVFISVGVLNKSIISIEDILKYSGDIFKFAQKNYRGLPRGLHSGIVTIPVLIGDNAANEAIKYCSKEAKKKWAAIEIPVIIEMESETITYYRGKRYWGAMYSNYLRNIIESRISSLIK